MLDAPRWLWHASLGQGQSVPGEICLLDERVCLSGRNACRGNVGPMTKSQLIQRIAELNPHLYQRDVERIVSTVFDEISTALADGDRVELRGFGAFSVKVRDSRVGRNPRTGATVRVARKAVPFFKTGKQLRDMLNIGSPSN